MQNLILYLAVVMAVIDWFAVGYSWKKIEYVAKPGVMLLLLAWLGFSSGLQGHLIWFGLGLLFSMAGDIFLMLPHEQFIGGLVAFLLAHLAYLVGFNSSLPPVNLPSLLLVLGVGLTAGRIYRSIAAGLASSGHTQLKLPVMVYSAAISLMLLSALLTLVRTDWAAGPALLVSAGAILFFLSDTFLAWNRFVTPLPFGKLRVIISYHLGQVLIALGATLHFLAHL